MPRPPGYRELLESDELLDAALAEAAHSTRPGWDLAITAFHLIQRKRFDDALRVYDAIIERPLLELSVFCNALWVVQHDNTGLPLNEARARRYLQHALRHAPMNPPIWLNAAGVLLELGEVDAAVDALVLAARRCVPLTEHFTSPLMSPVKAHARWEELERESRPLEWDEPDARRMFREVSPTQLVDRLVALLDHADPRVVHRAIRQLLWWRQEDGDDGHGGRAFPELLAWYERVGEEISSRLTMARFAELASRDLAGTYAFEAAYTVNISQRNGWEDASVMFPRLGAQLGQALREADVAVRQHLVDGLMWGVHRKATEPIFRAHVQPELVRFVEAMADGPGLSDVPKVELDLLRGAVQVLHRLDALGGSRPALARIVEKARGEVWDRYLRDELRKLIS